MKKRFDHLSQAPLSFFQVFNFQKWPLSRQELGDFGVDELCNLLHHASISQYFTRDEQESILRKWTGLKLQIASLRTSPIMNFTKSKYRSTLNQTPFNNQLLIMQEGPKHQVFNPGDAVEHWMTTRVTTHVKDHRLSWPKRQVEQPVRMEVNFLKDLKMTK